MSIYFVIYLNFKPTKQISLFSLLLNSENEKLVCKWL